MILEIILYIILRHKYDEMSSFLQGSTVLSLAPTFSSSTTWEPIVSKCKDKEFDYEMQQINSKDRVSVLAQPGPGVGGDPAL